MTNPLLLQRSAVIFDMDGVLVDTEPVYIDISRRLLKRLGIQMPEERLHSYVGIPAERIWAEIRQDFGLQESVKDLLQVEKEEQLRELDALDRVPVVNGIMCLVAKLKNLGFYLGIGSSSSKSVIDLILAKTGLRQHFNAVVSAEEVEHGKPAPDIFIAVADRLGCIPSACLVVEDSPHGIRAAKTAGMKAVGFENISSGNQDLFEADLIIKDLTDESIIKVVDLAYEASGKVKTRSKHR
jgi:HAD superfamily hydrolase (TIGR01509 family)